MILKTEESLSNNSLVYTVPYAVMKITYKNPMVFKMSKLSCENFNWLFRTTS